MPTTSQLQPLFHSCPRDSSLFHREIFSEQESCLSLFSAVCRPSWKPGGMAGHLPCPLLAWPQAPGVPSAVLPGSGKLPRFVSLAPSRPLFSWNSASSETFPAFLVEVRFPCSPYSPVSLSCSSTVCLFTVLLVTGLLTCLLNVHLLRTKNLSTCSPLPLLL